MFATASRHVYPVIVNGAAGAVITEAGRAISLMAFTVVAGRIATIDVVYTTSSGATITLKSTEITGKDFQANNVMTGLPIDFMIPNPSPTNLEFRTRMRGMGVVTQSATKIFRSR